MMNTIDEVMTYLTTTEGSCILRDWTGFRTCYYAMPSNTNIQSNIADKLVDPHKGWFGREDAGYSRTKYTLNPNHTWKPKKVSAKLTDAQYTALRTFADVPEMSVASYSGSGYFHREHSRSTDVSKGTVEVLKRLGYIESTPQNKFYCTITPAGIAAHDAYAAQRGDHDFAQAEIEFDTRRKNAEASRDAKRIVVEGDYMFQKGKASDVTLRITSNGVLIGTHLEVNHIDDMIALLTEAKHEIARRAAAKY